jgi:hypothetical protein
MDTTSVAGYVLCRIEDDSSLTPIGEHEDISAAVVAGKHQVEVENLDFSYALYADGAALPAVPQTRTAVGAPGARLDEREQLAPKHHRLHHIHRAHPLSFCPLFTPTSGK